MPTAFYFQASLYVSIWWILISCSAQKPLYKVAEGAVVTVPSWMSTQFLLLLQKCRPAAFNGLTVGLALALSFPGVQEVRVLAAVLYTLYHLAESSETNRHGEYPILYAMWAMCLNDDTYRHASVWGITIHFILSTGYVKLSAGGWTPYGIPRWVLPNTMSTYLSGYGTARHRLNQPLSLTLNRIAANSPTLCTTISVLTLFVECILAPATLWLDPSLRPMACYAMILMHVGIACFMSIKVGVVFITSLPAYVYGFYCTAPIASPAWQVAVVLGLGPTIASMFLLPLPENWPLTPVSLFMWNGTTAQALLRLFMTRDTRLVLATEAVANMDIVGLRVLHHGELLTSAQKDAGSSPVVHDAVLRILGFTMVQGGDAIVQAVQALGVQDASFEEEGSSAPVSESTKALVYRIGAWLPMERRLVEVQSGEPLTHAYFVRVDEGGNVAEVLA
eukprot:Nitzschia sp. Nitz4//scaffold30_size153850//131475//132818//NITZ4_002795-RA/size153850-processed-gene-0.22-mRNA-1//1//CDS//3329547315//56//frame0